MDRNETKNRLGKYKIIKTLGQGGEGCVYLAEDENLSRRVAVKRLWNSTAARAVRDGEPKQDSEKQAEQAADAKLTREAAFLRDLRHPMLPIVYELFETDAWYLVMEYIEGISLHNYIEAFGEVEEEQGRIWAASLLDVLYYLHTRETPVIYRDLKPDNIMVCRNGELRLVDFGGAAHRCFGQVQDKGMAATAGFSAPEQWGAGGGAARADERSDIYAFGKTLFYMITGADPGTAPYTLLPVSAYNPLLSEELERIIRRCIAEKPEARYQTVAEIRRDLEGKGRSRSRKKRDFVRHVEKQIYLAGRRFP